ncbi:HNH endonuclease-domain-containing protein [Tuber indicum]|nr:HNH endonuclease-domain-containing protein [Tuber indicum]
MSPNRALPRNVSVYDDTNPKEALGGLVQNGSITEANFLDILGILLVVDAGSLRVQEKISNRMVCGTDVPLKIGIYDIHREGIDEPWILRLVSRYTSLGEDIFRDQVTDHDWRCVISGIANPEILIQADNWAGFEAAHIFPLEHESLWVSYNHGRWITDMDDAAELSKINSPQNSILLRADVHQMFKQYLVCVNTDDGYEADLHCDSVELLRWHLRQSVLANMRGAEEPAFEHDFLLGTDMVGEILAGPCAHGRFEFEIAARLREAASAHQLIRVSVTSEKIRNGCTPRKQPR